MPHNADKYSYICMFFNFPAVNGVCCLCRQEGERQNTWCEHATRTFLTVISFEREELSLLPQCWEPLCALIFYLTGLPLIRTRRHEGAPWRFSVGMTSPHISFYFSGNSWGVANAFKGPAVLTQSAAWNISLVTKLTRTTLVYPGLSLQAEVGCLGSRGQESLKMHWFKLTWIVLLIHCCHVKAVHHFYNLC